VDQHATLDPQQRQVAPIASVPAGHADVYGFCLYRSQGSGAFFAIADGELYVLDESNGQFEAIC
jgi:myo-inositol-hexaphosphate 3-phosphohydrolase